MIDANQWLATYDFDVRLTEIGRIVSIGDGIAWIEGLPNVENEAMLFIEDGSLALVYQLQSTRLGAILLKQTLKLSAGLRVYRQYPRLKTPTDDALLGRIIDPLGNVLDDKERIAYHNYQNIDVYAPTITERGFVEEPLYTGNKIIDTMLPIGKGQRELLIGDNGLGKSSIAIETVIHQKEANVRCVYVLIGQNRTNTVNVIEELKKFDALRHTVIVVAEGGDLVGLQWLAPFAGCTIAESWMRQGYDTLIIYDDLTAHANTYRQLSLLLNRPPGREAYPADIFYLHSRLLERSTHLSPELGGGSMTALPIAETKEGEIASYIPTNLISITDGQIYFDQKHFTSGFIPAIDIKLSVSRLGGKAQIAPIKNEAGRMKLDYLQFLELENFTRLGTHLDLQTKEKIDKGKLLREILKQNRLQPLSIRFHYGWMISYNEGLFDDVEHAKLNQFLVTLNEKLIESTLGFHQTKAEWIKELKMWKTQWKQLNGAS